MCKRHAICEGQSDCIYLVNGEDQSVEGLEARFNVPVPFSVTPLGDLALAISEAVPTIPLIDTCKIAAYLDSLGYCVAPF